MTKEIDYRERILSKLEIMEKFELKNANKEDGRMGSYCYAGQQYFAYHHVKGSGIPTRKTISLLELTVV